MANDPVNASASTPRFGRRAADRRLAQDALQPEFVSQVLATAPSVPSQSASVGKALGAYAAGAQSAVRRLPQGYRKTVII